MCQWKRQCFKGTIGPFFALKGQHIFFQGMDGGWGCWRSRSGYIYVNMPRNRQSDDGGALKWQHQPVEVLFLTFSTCGMSTRTGLFCAWKVINGWLLPTLRLNITSFSYMRICSKYQHRKEVSLGGSWTCLRIYDGEFSVYARGYVWSPQITEVLKGSHWFTMWPQSCLQVRETYTWFCFTSKQRWRLWTETSTPESTCPRGASNTSRALNVSVLTDAPMQLNLVLEIWPQQLQNINVLVIKQKLM